MRQGGEGAGSLCCATGHPGPGPSFHSALMRSATAPCPERPQGPCFKTRERVAIPWSSGSAGDAPDADRECVSVDRVSKCTGHKRRDWASWGLTIRHWEPCSLLLRPLPHPGNKKKKNLLEMHFSPCHPPFFFSFHRLKRKIKYIPGTRTAAEQTQTRKCLKMF